MSPSTLQRHVDMLPSADGQRQPLIGIGSNLHIARSPEGTIQVILDNADAPTNAAELKRATLSYGVDFDSSDDCSMLNCVVLEFDMGVDAFAVAKMSEHLLQEPDKHLSGDDLVHTLEMFRTLVETASSGWTFQRVIGLWAELKSLHRLLNLCENDAESSVCVAAWKSTGVHCQDFVFPGGRFAFDSKATTKAQRIHEISSIDQVARREATQSCLMSYVLRPVAEDEGLAIPQLIESIASLLQESDEKVFRQKVTALKLDDEVCGSHHFRERHARPTTLYSVDDIPGVLQFTPLPPGVPTLAWPVVLSEGTSHGMAMNALLEEWIKGSTQVMTNE
ncbi:PD-(D/E)XK motif protein [Candidatus Poseidoniales archaeon]|nr:PD-(D/E)XK motif protein [Candidatus Poseidoniales archaeon]